MTATNARELGAAIESELTDDAWLSLAASVPGPERAKMLENPAETPTTKTDPVAAELIAGVQAAMDAVKAASIALDDALFTNAALGTLTTLSYEMRKAVIVADSRANALCVWAATAPPPESRK